ncbi:hypothetical protein F4556_000945 [Kitasatospora gansuensis]|uniref:Uncharacterized protein n=1 Tax=Kitasatospora gansuensis TaxID=258050 RepID=A0A7W7S7Q1_9ACTN|nr:hypothetical protein [Kitasatospora gansuensis]MBB4945410.1 hypothetical protein [Kitasatospora gansuensis]
MLVLGGIADARYELADSASELNAAGDWMVAADVLGLVAALLAVQVVERISALQESRAAQVWAVPVGAPQG